MRRPQKMFAHLYAHASTKRFIIQKRWQHTLATRSEFAANQARTDGGREHEVAGGWATVQVGRNLKAATVNFPCTSETRRKARC
jgi:hypothetical protein